MIVIDVNSFKISILSIPKKKYAFRDLITLTLTITLEDIVEVKPSSEENLDDPFVATNNKFHDIYAKTKGITLSDRVQKAVIGNLGILIMLILLFSLPRN